MKSLVHGESPRAYADEEDFPSSFMKQEARVKNLCPCLRSYVFRRQLSFAAIASVFVIAGVLISVVVHSGELNSEQHFSKREM
jgi:hypothetical protein